MSRLVTSVSYIYPSRPLILQLCLGALLEHVHVDVLDGFASIDGSRMHNQFSIPI